MSQIWSVSRRVAGRSFWSLLAIGAGTSATGCSAVLGLETSQCNTTEDCDDRFGQGVPYLCTNNLCERAICDTDRDCQARGENYKTSICDDLNRCREPECTDNNQCGVGVCDRATFRCTERQCNTTEQCFTRENFKYASPTVQCLDGLCVDQTWGCIGQPDDRPRTPFATATFKIPIIDGTTGRPDPTFAFRIRACRLPSFDRDCTTQMAGTNASYDMVSGVATITGITEGTQIRVAIDPPEGTNEVIPIDFYTPKVAVGETTTPPVRLVYRKLLEALTTSSGGNAMTVDPTLGNYFGMFFDCQDKPAANMQLSPLQLHPTKAPLILFFGETSLPVLTATSTLPSGIFSALNILAGTPVTVQTTLVASLGASSSLMSLRPVNKYEIFALPERLTTIHFYARDYAR